MTLGNIKKITTNYSFRIPLFDRVGWGREVERNFDIIDAALYAATSLGGITGVWANNTAYVQGNRVVDASDNTIWQCLVGHTSPTTGTFSDARTANPTYWEAVTQSFNYTGQWATATNYNVNDIFFDGYVWGIAKTRYTSGASLAVDIANGDVATIFNGTATINAATVAKEAAEDAQTAAELAEFNAETAQGLAEDAQAAAELAETGAVTAQGLAETAQSNAEDAETLAQAWASNPEDFVVSGGLYSALHYAAKAADSESAAAIHASGASDSADAAALSELNAQTAETNAELAQAAAEAAAANTVRFDIVQSKTPAQKGQARANIGALAVRENDILNGDFLIALKGTSGSGYSSGTITFDRWRHHYTSGLTPSYSLVQLTPGTLPFRYYARFIQSGTGASGSNIRQRLEGLVIPRANKKVTVTLWLALGTAGSVTVSLRQSFGTGGSPSPDSTSVGVTFSVTTTLTRYDAVIDLPSVVGKTFGTNGDDYIELIITVNQANSSDLRVAHVGMGEGDLSADSNPFPTRPIAEDAALCRRYLRLIRFWHQITATAAGQTVAAMTDVSDMRTVPSITVVSESITNMGSLSSSILASSGAMLLRSFGSSSAAGAANLNAVYLLDAELGS